MKLIALLIAVQNTTTKKVFILTRQYQLSNVSFMYRNTVKDTFKFVARQALPGLQKNSRHSVTHQQYLCHIQVWTGPMAALAFCDKQYPRRVAFGFLNKVLQEFNKKHVMIWKNVESDDNLNVPQIKKLFQEYRDAKNADKLTLAQSKVDETKIILHDNIKKLLQRQGDLDKLVEKSNDLSANAKAFYKSSKKINKGCCQLI